ncbi:hypothetical protein KW799_00655 [Candidatus Parcubacteria bacterium]|nr:hypothetical protein [Candidatus Parcubacteria bacterium]
MEIKTSRLQAWFSAFISLFILMSLGSKPFGWMRNAACLPHLGCNTGFFGYDALTHFVGGVALAIGLAWIIRRYPRLHIFHREFLKNVFVILAVAALIGVLWELLEYGFDYVRIVFFHMNLASPNQMAQAGNSDTMGDLFFGLLGSFIAAAAMKAIDRDIF